MADSHIERTLPAEDRYPKLVRDKIPQRLERKGIAFSTRVLLDDTEYLQYLLAKLAEESTELAYAKASDDQREELADIYEVLEAILVLMKLKQTDISKVQADKRQKRGGFKKRLLMLSKP